MLNWREIPFVRLLLPFLVGIFLAHQFAFHSSSIDLLLLVLAGILFGMALRPLAFAQRWWYGVLLHLFLLLFGFQLTIHHNDRLSPSYFGSRILKSNTIRAKVLDLQEKGERFRLVLSVESIGTPDSQQVNCKGQLLSYLPNDSLTRQLQYGDLLLIHTKITPISPPQNPHAFDFRQYWQSQNIYHQCFVQAKHWQLLARDRGHLILAKAFDLRSQLLTILRAHLPSENEYAVAAALILGSKEYLTSELRNAYAGTGAMHVLAVSGLHVGFIYLGLAFLLRLIRSRHPYWLRLKVVFLILGIWSFALLTGASASVMRAAAMFSFLIIGQAMKHHPSIYNSLAASAFCLLCWNPFLLLNVGFQLSYLAVLGIVYFQAKIYRLWVIDQVLGDYLWKMSSIALAAQLITFPISLYYFHQFPVYFWLSGLVVVPAAMVVLASGLLLFLFSPLIPFLAQLLGSLLYWSLWLMNAIIFLIHQIPAAVVPGIWISSLALLLLYLFLGNVILAIQLRQLKWIKYALFCLLVLTTGRIYRSIQQLQQKEIVFYKIYNKSLIDFVDGRQGVSLSDSQLSATDLAFTAQNHRWALGVQQTQSTLLDAPKFQVSNCHYDKGFVQFHQQRIGIFQGPPQESSAAKIHLDLVYLCPDAQWTIQDLK
ncbi:MAG: ComEC/Rec2 family competence protein, partial [Bacteroidota bacterium]